MKTLYLECNMGAAGDMLTAALLELLPDPAAFVKKLNELGLPGITYKAETAVKCGLTGTHMRVLVNGREEKSLDLRKQERDDRRHLHNHGSQEEQGREKVHHHVGLDEIKKILASLSLPEEVEQKALAVYRLIAEAESHAHGLPVEKVHFHEVGAMDAVADVVAVCLLLTELGPERILASPLAVGSGQVQCAHGIMPVPAPATAYLLRGVPVYGGTIQGELCTPTGAALLKYFVQTFGPMPMMQIQGIGYGMGQKDFAAANCVRAFWGETADERDEIAELCCNLDDMTPESVGYVQNLLLDAGALDVYTTAIGMKKNRPAVMLTCMCRQDQKEELARLMFKHTTTLGIREYLCRRMTLTKTEEIIKSPYGPLRVKRAAGWGTAKAKPEYEDLAAIARRTGLSLEELHREIRL